MCPHLCSRVRSSFVAAEVTWRRHPGSAAAAPWRLMPAAGFFHTVLLRSDGRVVACGDNQRGQCCPGGSSRGAEHDVDRGGWGLGRPEVHSTVCSSEMGAQGADVDRSSPLLAWTLSRRPTSEIPNLSTPRRQESGRSAVASWQKGWAGPKSWSRRLVSGASPLDRARAGLRRGRARPSASRSSDAAAPGSCRTRGVPELNDARGVVRSPPRPHSVSPTCLAADRRPDPARCA